MTVIPNETYETFARQYQEEIREVYGTTAAGAGMTHSERGKSKNKISFTRNRSRPVEEAVRRLGRLARKTEYTVASTKRSLSARPSSR